MQSIPSSTRAICRVPNTQTPSMLNVIVNKFEEFNSSAISSGMPPKLQEAIIHLILEKKSKGDIWISQNDITSALICLEDKLAGEHQTIMQNYRKNAESNNALGLLLSDGAILYRQHSGKEIFISINEWVIPEDTQFYANEFLPLRTQLNLAQTCQARFKIISDTRFWQAKFLPGKAPTMELMKAFRSNPELRKGSVVRCDQIGKKYISKPITFDIDIQGFFGTPPRRLGRLTIQQIENGKLTVEEATQIYRERAQEITKIYAVEIKKDNPTPYNRAQLSEAYVLDGLVTVEKMATMIHSGEGFIVFTSPKLVDCIYAGLISLDKAFQLSELQRYAVNHFKQYVDDKSLAFDQILALTAVEMCVLKKLEPQFKAGSINITQAASLLKPLVEAMNLTYEKPWENGRDNPEIAQTILELTEKVIEAFLEPLCKTEQVSNKSHETSCSVM